MNRYWRIKRDDEELDKFLNYIKKEYSYVEESGLKIYPSQVSYADYNYNETSVKNTIIVETIDKNLLVAGYKIFSQGFYINNGEKKPLIIRWIEDNEKEIVNWSIRALRKDKIKKIKNNILSNDK